MRKKNIEKIEASITPDMLISKSLRKTSPWNDDPIEFFESDRFCNAHLYPNQRLMLKLWNLQLDNLNDYENATLDRWCKQFKDKSYTVGVQEDIRERMQELIANGYDHFSIIIDILGRRASKSFLTGLQLTLQDANLLWYGIPSVIAKNDDSDIVDKDTATYSFVMATTANQAQETSFASHYDAVLACKWLRQYAYRIMPFEILFQTLDDKLRTLQLIEDGAPIEKDIASLIARPVSSNSDANRGRACLTPNTLILKQTGEQVLLDDLQVGDRVAAFYENDQDVRTNAIVLNKWESFKETVRITFATNRSITCTPDHKFVSSDNIWYEAKDIKPGMKLKGNKQDATVKEVKSSGKTRVIDITTSSSTFIANNIYTHNCVSLVFDEIFFALGGDSSRAGDVAIKALQPSLQQFGKDKMMMFPSSPWSRTGYVYDLYTQGKVRLDEYLEKNGLSKTSKNVAKVDQQVEATAEAIQANPTIFVAQLESWRLYENYEDQAYVPTYYSGFTPKKLVVKDKSGTSTITANTNAKAGDFIYVKD